MEQIFLTVLNMSITGSYMIAFVMFLRLFLKRVPKVFSYSMWGIVLVRLMIPFSFSSTFSILRLFKINTTKYIPSDIGYMNQPQIDVGIGTINQWVNNYLPEATVAASINPMQVIIFICSVVWVIGIIGLLIYSIISYICLHRKVSTAMLISDNIFESEKIKSPFVLGIINPNIYLPIGLSQREQNYIMLHEQTHIKRFDYLIKPLAFLVLCVHWFNPLVWVSFILMNQDMEMSCDEYVLRKMGNGIKKEYSHSLLTLAVSGSMMKGSPLAFGESNTKGRIENVLNYKKPTFWVVVIGVIMVIVIGIGLLSNPENNKPDLSFLNINNTASVAMQQNQVLIKHGGGTSLVSGDEFGKLLDLSSNNWQEKKFTSPYELSPDLTIYINIGSRHEVRFYESEPGLAMVLFDGKYRYYKIPVDLYEKVYMMWAKSSYIVPEEMISAVLSGKRTNRKSVQDTPNHGDYKILEVGSDKYYIYEGNSKYYIEQPYQFINEISEEIYQAAIKYATEP